MTKSEETRPLMVTIQCLTYNHESYIRQCLDGFVMQKTNFNFEAIVHDDASTDGTALIIKEYAEKYPDIIKPIYETENQYSKKDGSLNRIMMEHTLGKYVAICEGDDYWIDSEKLQKQVDYMEKHPECGLIYTDLNFYNQGEKRMIYSVFDKGEIPIAHNYIEMLKYRRYIAPCTWLIKPMSGLELTNQCTDFTFYLALQAFAKYEVHYIPIVTAVYRQLEESASHSTSLEKYYLYNKGVFETQKKFIKFYPDKISEDDAKYILRSGVSRLFKYGLLYDDKQFVSSSLGVLVQNRMGKDLILYYLPRIIVKKILKFHYTRKGFCV